jgi:hypothetical protein
VFWLQNHSKSATTGGSTYPNPSKSEGFHGISMEKTLHSVQATDEQGRIDAVEACGRSFTEFGLYPS